jgi:hypothetical protein
MNRRNDPIYRKCDVCGNSFREYRPWAKYCSTKCSRKAARQRDKAELARLYEIERKQETQGGADVAAVTSI